MRAVFYRRAISGAVIIAVAVWFAQMLAVASKGESPNISQPASQAAAVMASTRDSVEVFNREDAGRRGTIAKTYMVQRIVGLVGIAVIGVVVLHALGRLAED